jgi:hypothetical protein
MPISQKMATFITTAVRASDSTVVTHNFEAEQGPLFHMT